MPGTVRPDPFIIKNILPVPLWRFIMVYLLPTLTVLDSVDVLPTHPARLVHFVYSITGHDYIVHCGFVPALMPISHFSLLLMFSPTLTCLIDPIFHSLELLPSHNLITNNAPSPDPFPTTLHRTRQHYGDSNFPQGRGPKRSSPPSLPPTPNTAS